jgi:DNA topoisomerase-2
MASKKYIKLDPREHVLTRPGMYIGSLESDPTYAWVYTDKMEYKEISYISGLYKIYDEIIVNVLDHVVRCQDKSKPVKEIRINIDKSSGYIEVYNSGEGIEIEKHEQHKVYIPELIFGNMLTSTNYDDNDERIIGGQNGIGAKACNIFSKEFTIETVDSKKKLLYTQTFSENMQVKSEPIIEKYTRYPYTKIRYLPDFKKFNIKKLSNDMYILMIKRVYDICALTPMHVKIFLDDVKIDYKNFEKYSELYIGTNKTELPRTIIKSENDRWEVCISTSETGYKQVSFVNGIYTLKGGKHVEYITNQITKKLFDMIQKKRKTTVKQHFIKDHLFLIIKATINNPTFDSQTKETLTTPYTKFGSKFDIDDKVIEKIYKMNIIDKIIALSDVNDNKNAKKTDGKKKSSLRGLPKLDDANWAGTSKSQECILILTEGDSAKTMAISGLSEVGRDKYGVFPLKGKIMNVKDTNCKRINDNEEITNLKKIIGLELNKEYENTEDLRYGQIMILTDADADGSHIKGLLFNLFHTLWPSLMKINFLTSMITPIVKIIKGKKSKSFYNISEYEDWKLENNIGWDIKYYKGLGTSTSKEAKEYFKNMKSIQYTWDDEHSENSIELAFNKKKADERKEWLYGYNRDSIIKFDEDSSKMDVEFSEFINKDLIHFSNYNLERSIPNLCDGLKKSLRKILYCAFKRRLYKEIKVSQFAGYVSEHGAYHHGEVSLHEAIIGMAQDFVGSNNINLFIPGGQFGTRIQGGKDSASPRYIHTMLNSIVEYIYHPDDFEVIQYLNDDGMTIEPEYYIPIIPMILVNGSIGIGTGFSTNIPCFNPKDLINYIRLKLKNEKVNTLTPWYKNHKGTISDNISKGIVTQLNKTKIEVNELPIGYWTEDFKNTIENYMDNNPKIIKDYESHYTEKDVKFIITFHSNIILTDMLSYIDTKGCMKIEHELKMTTTRLLNQNNMHLYDKNGVIKKYECVNDIIDEFYEIRLEMYVKRKDNKIRKLENELIYINAKIKFIQSIMDKRLKIMNNTKVKIEEFLIENNIPKHNSTYDYLIKMPIYNLTEEKQKELHNDHDIKSKILNEITSTSIEEMWLNDLSILEKKLN